MAYPTLTIKAANLVFSVLNIEITKSELGFFEARYNGQAYQAKLLRELSEKLILAIAASTPAKEEAE